MGSIPVGDSDISLSHARVMLINSSITLITTVCYVVLHPLVVQRMDKAFQRPLDSVFHPLNNWAQPNSRLCMWCPELYIIPYVFESRNSWSVNLPIRKWRKHSHANLRFYVKTCKCMIKYTPLLLLGAKVWLPSCCKHPNLYALRDKHVCYRL